MSTIQIDGDLFFRSYGNGDKLPLPWEKFRGVLETDTEVVIVDHEHHEQSQHLPIEPELLEELGLVMLKGAIS